MHPCRNSECVRFLLVFDFNRRSMPRLSPTAPSRVRARDKINELFLSSLRRGFLNDGYDGVVPVAVKFVVLDVEFV